MSDNVFTIQSPRHASPLRAVAGAMDALGTSAYALVREWWRRYRSRLELTSYSHDQRKDFGFSADVDSEITKPFWKK